MMDEVSGVDTETSDSDESTLTPEQTSSLDKALSFANLAEGLKKDDPELLSKIGKDCVDAYRNDDMSRSEWMDRNKEYMKLATQVMERKSWPWEGAANVKYPLLTTAALQFASRAFSSLVPSFDVVKAKVIGDDEQGQMTQLANKLSTHMSYTVMYEVEDWEESMDKLCYILPIVGSMFKKIYYSDQKKEICSDLLSPKDVVVHYNAKRIQDAARITEIQYYSVNEIKEKQNREEWLKFDQPFTHGTGNDRTLSDNKTTGIQAPTPDDETPRQFIEQYCRIDLDDDEYKEPYIVTVDVETSKVVRIVANFYSDDITWKDQSKKEVVCIEPAEWFVKFDFLPNPDGGFYGIGFGILLGGLNDMVNTITNQLIDAGTLANLQAGFIGRGLRDSKEKKMSFRPGEWKWVNNPGKDLKENVFPLPVREPSQTLFNLLGTLVQSGKEVASVAEIFTGKMPGQNTPAATTMATIEQGLKVFTSIYKRMFRGMGKEFLLMFDLMKRYAPSETVNVIGEMGGEKHNYNVSRFDYQKAESIKIMPAADPNMVSETQKLLKIQGLYELVQLGTINRQEMTRQALVYQGQENIDKLMQLPPPEPPLEVQIEQMKLQDKDKDRQLKQQELQMGAARLQAELAQMRSQAILNLAKARQADAADQIMQLEMELERISAQQEMVMSQQKHMQEMSQQANQQKLDARGQMIDLAMDAHKSQQEIQMKERMHSQELAHNEQMNQAKIRLVEAQAKAAAKAKPASSNAK